MAGEKFRTRMKLPRINYPIQNPSSINTGCVWNGPTKKKPEALLQIPIRLSNAPYNDTGVPKEMLESI